MHVMCFQFPALDKKIVRPGALTSCIQAAALAHLSGDPSTASSHPSRIVAHDLINSPISNDGLPFTLSPNARAKRFGRAPNLDLISMAVNWPKSNDSNAGGSRCRAGSWTIPHRKGECRFARELPRALSRTDDRLV